DLGPLVALALVGVAAFALWPASSKPGRPSRRATAVVNGVNQAELHACLAQRTTDCAKTVSGLADCLAKRLICNPEALKTPNDPLSHPNDPRAHLLTEQEVIALARKQGVDPQPDPSAHPAYAKRMTLQAWNGLTPSPESPTFD